MFEQPDGGEGDAPARAAARVVPVSRLVAAARLLIERELGLVWVAGEISNIYRASSGHLYFMLKDAGAQVRCTLWRQKAQRLEVNLRDGLAVEVRASPTLYEAKGEFQLNVDMVRLAGPGALYERFAQLKAKLEAAGWFAAERKRPLPRYARSIGVVTSPRGAALRDVLTTLQRRWPAAHVIVYPAAVQGTAAIGELPQAIGIANARNETDVLIVCRGGGSIEDLWAFNEEAVARAILESRIPVVAGIGHETDFTIADFVADVRAPTPTAAATLVVPDRDSLAHRIAQLARRVDRSAHHVLTRSAQRLDIAERRLAHPAKRIATRQQRLRDLALRLTRDWHRSASLRATILNALRLRLLRELRAPLPQRVALTDARGRLLRLQRDRLARAQNRVDALALNLAHLGPQAVLARGYAIVTTADATVVQDATQLAPGDDVTLTFARGRAGARVTSRE